MSAARAACVIVLTFVAGALAAEPASWTRQLKEDDQRDALHDRGERVRGDSGKWSDAPRVQHVILARKPEKLSLSDWSEQMSENEDKARHGDESWLLIQTQQLNDNDRGWVERIERKGDRFTVKVNRATWQGAYRKNCTYHQILAARLGKLEPGSYQATCVIHPLEFKEFTGTRGQGDHWSTGEQPSGEKPRELGIQFDVATKE